jgi:mutator protein MutT
MGHHSPTPTPQREEHARACADAKPDAPRRRVRRGAIGVLCVGQRYLLIRRADHLPKGGHWCFPGGHLEPGETSRQAVVRELAEETGLHVRILRRLGSVQVRDSGYVLAVWLVAADGQLPRYDPREISEARWIPLDELGTMNPGLPSNDAVIRMLRKYAAQPTVPEAG